MAINLDLINNNTTANITTNFQRVRIALQDAIGRHGNLPNHMEADFDLDGNDLLNGGDGQFQSLHVNGMNVEDLTGSKGWSPVFAAVSRGVDIVFQLKEYVGGTGDVPTDHVGEYVGEDGYVVNINDAVSFSSGGVSDGNKGDVTVAASGTVWSLNNEAVTEPKLDSALKAMIVGDAATRSALRALPTNAYASVHLRESLREGIFVWDGSNLAARKTLDPEQAVYIPPNTDTTGASGCWVRQFDGDLSAVWFGVRATESAAANSLGITRAIALADVLGCGVRLPGIEFDVSAAAGSGIEVKTNTHVYGEGYLKTVLRVKGGGSLAQLRNYQAGSLFRRSFNMAGTNQYVTNVLIEKLGIVMDHPLAAVTTTEIKIGVDFRNISRSEVRECWIGNYHPDLSIDAKGSTRPYLCQGYAVVCGNESNQPSYAGGECNTIRRNFIAGAYRAIAIDDNNLNAPQGSAAYSQRILENDIQIAQILIYQASIWGAANVIQNNTLQSLQVRAGNADTITCGIWIDGYGNIIEEPYTELGATASFILRLGGGSKRNRAKFSGTCSATGGIITEGTHRGFRDAGGGSSGNIIEFYADTAGGGAFNSAGSPQRMVSGTTTTVT